VNFSNVFAIFSLAFQFFTTKTGTVIFHFGGKTETVVVTEVGAAKPIGRFTLGEAVTLAEQVLAGQPGTFSARLGADEYSVTITVSA
jgi:hypothetical protein